MRIKQISGQTPVTNISVPSVETVRDLWAVRVERRHSDATVGDRAEAYLATHAVRLTKPKKNRCVVM